MVLLIPFLINFRGLGKLASRSISDQNKHGVSGRTRLEGGLKAFSRHLWSYLFFSNAYLHKDGVGIGLKA